MRVKSIFVLALPFFLFGSAPAGFAAIVSFQGLSDLPGGSFYSQANAISADGSVVVGSGRSALGTEAFRWTAGGGMVGLTGGYASDVSADGSVVVGQSGTAEAFYWTSASGVVSLGAIYDESSAYGISPVFSSASGPVIVGYDYNLQDVSYEAFWWENQEDMQLMGDLGGLGQHSVAYGVSDYGSVVVGDAISTSGYEAFRWTYGGGMQGLGDLPGGGFGSLAVDVTSDGSVIVGWGTSASGTEAFQWTSGGGMVGLGDLSGGSFSSIAHDLSNDGSVVVGWANSASGEEAFIWDAGHGMRSLRELLVSEGVNMTGWTLIRAYGISADGLTIVGYGNNPDGYTEAWVATVPEPATIILFALGGLPLLRKRKT